MENTTFGDMTFKRGKKETNFTSTGKRFNDHKCEVWMNGKHVTHWGTWEGVLRMMKRKSKLDVRTFENLENVLKADWM